MTNVKTILDELLSYFFILEIFSMKKCGSIRL